MPKNRSFITFRLKKYRNSDEIAKSRKRHRIRLRKIFRSTQFESKIKLVLRSYLSLKMRKNRYFVNFRLGNLEIFT